MRTTCHSEKRKRRWGWWLSNSEGNARNTGSQQEKRSFLFSQRHTFRSRRSRRERRKRLETHISCLFNTRKGAALVWTSLLLLLVSYLLSLITVCVILKQEGPFFFPLLCVQSSLTILYCVLLSSSEREKEGGESLCKQATREGDREKIQRQWTSSSTVLLIAFAFVLLRNSTRIILSLVYLFSALLELHSCSTRVVLLSTLMKRGRRKECFAVKSHLSFQRYILSATHTLHFLSFGAYCFDNESNTVLLGKYTSSTSGQEMIFYPFWRRCFSDFFHCFLPFIASLHPLLLFLPLSCTFRHLSCTTASESWGSERPAKIDDERKRVEREKSRSLEGKKMVTQDMDMRKWIEGSKNFCSHIHMLPLD